MTKHLSILLCSLLLGGMTLFAQTANTVLSGTVTTLSGAPVANAAVSVTNVGTNESKRELTGPDGKFSIAGLAPGTYTVVVEVAGFKRSSRQNIQISSTSSGPINISLEAGSTADTVELKGEAPATQTQSGEIGMSLDTREIRELPVIDRNHQQLTELETGVTPPMPALNMVLNPEGNRNYSVNGQSPSVNMFNVEGTVNWEPFSGTEIRNQPEELLQQTDIATSNYTENQGFSGGGVVQDLSRAGTNAWHGSAFEFWTGNPFDTRNVFDTATSGPPRYLENQPGAALGGAIVKDHTFFFGSYEGTFQNGDTAQLTTVPTAQALTGNFSAIPGVSIYSQPSVFGISGTNYPGNIIPSNVLNPAALSIAGYLPSANLPGLFNNYLATTPAINHDEKADGRIDQHFTDRTSAYVRYGFSNDYARLGSPLGPVIGLGTQNHLIADNAVIDLTHEFTPRLIADARFAYNRYWTNVQAWGNSSALSGLPGLSGFTGSLASIQIPGLATIGAPAYLPEKAVDNTFQWATGWNLIASNHNLKWGVDVRRIRSDGFTDSVLGQMFGPNGSFSFGPGATLNPTGTTGLSQYSEFYNAFAAFLTGSPGQYGISNDLVEPTIRQTEYSAWIGDTLQFFGRLTVNFGLRYEIYSPLQPSFTGGAEYFNPSTNTFNYAGMDGTDSNEYRYDLKNLAPRFGYAFKVTDKTVIRGGYGISYFQTPYMYSGMMTPAYGSVIGTTGSYAVAPELNLFNGMLTNSPPTGALTNGTVAGDLPAAIVPRNLQTPYIQSFSTQLQQEFYWGTVLSVGYVGTLGRELPFIEQLNGALPGTGLAGLPYASLGRTGSTLSFDNALTDNYNSLQVKLSKRFSKGLSFNSAYTYSKALGYTSGNDMLLNPFNLQSNYGPLDYDRQSVLSISHLWELPFGRNGKSLAATVLGGWQLNGIFSWATGTPLTLTSDALTCGCTNLTPFASTTGVSPIYLANGSLNPAAFTFAGTDQFGNLGRGAVRGPGFTNYDLGLFKDFKVREKVNVELRGEAYNLANSAHYLNPVTSVSSASFGTFTGTSNGAFGRQIKLGFRLLF